MTRAMSAADANRNFSQLLRKVRDGRSFVITSHGRPVARIVPIDARSETNAGAHTALLAHLRAQRVIDAGKWTRDELYDDEP